jgi:hypothetical protein
MIPHRTVSRALRGAPLLVVALVVSCHAPRSASPAPITLFDGTSLSAFDVFLRSTGLNADTGRVFRVENGVIHVSGKENGYFITKRSFRHYRLRAEFKWGEGTYGGRAGKARDSGVLYHVQGPDKVWPRSVEFQIQEGATGDFWMTDEAQLTGRNGVRVTGPAGRALPIDRFNKGPWKNEAGFRDPVNEVERPHGEWNTFEIVVEQGRIRHYVNGTFVNEGTDPFPSDGKILFQSEGAEIFFRNIVLQPLN